MNSDYWFSLCFFLFHYSVDLISFVTIDFNSKSLFFYLWNWVLASSDFYHCVWICMLRTCTVCKLFSRQCPRRRDKENERKQVRKSAKTDPNRRKAFNVLLCVYVYFVVDFSPLLLLFFFSLASAFAQYPSHCIWKGRQNIYRMKHSISEQKIISYICCPLFCMVLNIDLFLFRFVSIRAIWTSHDTCKYTLRP